jgi:2,5-diketo-D-gluconate reductase B
MKGEVCERAVRTALELGYRHIDTAEMYANEAEIGRAVKASGVPREQIFITTKLWNTHLAARDVGPTLDASLTRLATDYVDLLLIHWPTEDVPLKETLPAMIEAKAAGKAKAIGVSNFTVPMMREAIETIGAPIVCNQLEYHALLDQRPALDYARKHKIAVTAYCPLARGGLVDNPTLKRIGAGYGKSAAQVALRWLVQQPGVAAIPKASRPENLAANFQVFDFALTSGEMDEISRLRNNSRVVPPDWWKR